MIQPRDPLRYAILEGVSPMRGDNVIDFRDAGIWLILANVFGLALVAWLLVTAL